MPNGKPLYPLPWWANSCPPPRYDDCAFEGEEFILRYVGTDCDGNPLFCLRRRRPPCDTRPVAPQPRCYPR